MRSVDEKCDEKPLSCWVRLSLSLSLSAGLKLQGATCANNKLSLSNTISTELPLTQLCWVKQFSEEKRHMVGRHHSTAQHKHATYMPLRPRANMKHHSNIMLGVLHHLCSNINCVPPRLQVTLPVYLNFTRSDLIFTVDFDIATKEDPHNFYERGVAVLCTE